VFEKVKPSGPTSCISEASQIKTEKYKYPLYTTSIKNIINGYVEIPNYINDNNDNLYCMTVFGYISYIEDKEFSIQIGGTSYVLKSDIKFNDYNLKIISLQISTLSDFNNKLTYDKIKDINIYLYI